MNRFGGDCLRRSRVCRLATTADTAVPPAALTADTAVPPAAFTADTAVPHAGLTAEAAVPHGRRGFTLVELVLSMAIMSILMTGLVSAIVIASHALPDNDSTPRALVEGAEVADLIAEDLRSATWIRERTATSVEFAVPDRDADGSAERICYAWSSKAGDPLTRQYNGGTVVDIVDSVQEFELAYDLKTLTEEYPGPPVESAETLLSSYTAANDLGGYSIDSTDWIGQYFEPSLDPNAVRWKVTRVMFEARARNAADGQVLVQLRPADPDGLPTDTVLEQHTLYESDLTDSYLWQEFAFSNVSALSPDDGLCLVLKFAAGSWPAASVRYDNVGVSGEFYTYNAGADWGMTFNDELRHYVYGTYFTPGPPQTATRQYVMSVRVTLRTGSDPASRVVTTAQTLNCPELLSARWEADFDDDPRLDHNGDGLNDWGDYGGVFDAGTLSDGIWYAPDHGEEGISTVPDEDFAELTTVDLRYRAASVGGWGTVFWINADRRGAASANIVAALYKPGAASQELWFGWELANGTMDWVNTYDVPDDFVDVRLVIDPVEGTVAVFVDGTHRDTLAYFRVNPDPDAAAWLFTNGCSGEFDRVSIRVGGNN